MAGVLQGIPSLYTHYSLYKHVTKCRKSPHPGSCAVGENDPEISAENSRADGFLGAKSTARSLRRQQLRWKGSVESEWCILSTAGGAKNQFRIEGNRDEKEKEEISLR